MDATIRPLRFIDWSTFVILVIAVCTLVVVSCGDDDDSVEIDDPTWTVTVDPYGREWGCLMVDTGSYAGGLFCAPAPTTP